MGLLLLKMFFPEEETKFDRTHGFSILVFFIIAIALFLMLITSANATDAYYDKLSFRYQFNNTASDNKLANLTEKGTVTYDAARFGKGLTINTDAEADFRNAESRSNINATSNACILVAVNLVGYPAGSGESDFIAKYEGGSDGYTFGIGQHSHATIADKPVFDVREQGKGIQYVTGNNVLSLGEHTFVANYNRTGNDKVTFYIDGVLQTNTGTLTDTAIAPDAPITFGGMCQADNCAVLTNGIVNAVINDYTMYHRLCNGTEVLSYNNTLQVAWSSGAAPPPTPTLTLYTNLANDVKTNANPYTFYWNGTPAFTSNSNFNCSLRLNGTIYTSKIPTNIQQNQNFQITTTGWQRGYDLNVSCKNNNATASFLKTGIYFDTVNPVLNIYEFKKSGTYYSDTDYAINVSMSDQNLAGYNYTIWKNVSNVLTKVYSRYYASLTGGTYKLLNLTNSSLWCPSEPCNMKVKTVIWDDHNPLIGPHEVAKDITTTSDSLTLKFKTGDVSIQALNIKTFDVVDADNKYKLDFQFNSPGDNTIILKNPDLWIFRDTEHKAHFYSPYLMKYFDLDSQDITINKITRQSDGYHIDINIKESLLKTNSIGDLNVVTNYSYFTILERPTLSTELLTDINQSLTSMLLLQATQNSNTLKIKEAIDLIPFILLWLGLWIFGYYAIQTSNTLLGGTMIVLTVPLDLYFSYRFQEILMIGTGFIGIAFTIIAAWTFGILILIKRRIPVSS